MTSASRIHVASPLRALGKLFFRGIAKEMVMQILVILALIEGVFLAERFSAVFDLGVESHASVGEISLMLLSASPEILDLALAIAVLIGVYRVLLRAREDRELVVMASAGLEIRSIVGMLLRISLVSCLISLLISGVVAPVAQYGQRVIVFNAEYRALRYGAIAGQFYFFPGHVVFAGPEREHAQPRRLFIREQSAGLDRIITANRATLEGPNAQGKVSLGLRDFLSYDFNNDPSAARREICPSCPPLPSAFPPMTVRAPNLSVQFDREQLIHFDPRGTDTKEWTLFELLGLTTTSRSEKPADVASLGERFARSLLCLLAPLFGFAAFTFTNRATRMLALPAACAALLLLDLGAILLIAELAPFGKVILLAALSTLAFCIALVLVLQMERSHCRVLRPALARS
jgi:lipopolysaccharide export system permease protein